MTDKEKMDNLVAEIERRKKEVKDNIFELGNSESERIGLFDKEEIYNDILSFYNSMQKEPKSHKPKITVGEATGKLKEMLEEPASDNLEQAIDTYLTTYFGNEKEKQDWPFLKKMAIHFAQWQKEQLENNRLKHCDSITNEQAELEQGFIDQHLDKYQRMPTFLDAIEYGMRLQKEQMMAKAVDGIVHHHGNCKVASVYYNDPNNVPMAYYIPSEGVSEGDVVKIITIKED